MLGPWVVAGWFSATAPTPTIAAPPTAAAVVTPAAILLPLILVAMGSSCP